MTQYIVRADYAPREQVSPSSIKLARMCERAWGYRYILGYKEPEVEWEAIKDSPKPPDKDAVKAWNRLRRPALGKAVHALLEDWYAQRPVDWHSAPGVILLPALMYFPHPKHFTSFKTEEKIHPEFVAAMTDGRLNYEFNAYIDLNGLLQTKALACCDAKSTSSFDWAAKPAELLEDTQGIVYPLYTIWRHLVEGRSTQLEITPRWVYMLTEGRPAARAVDFKVTYAGARRRALPLFDEGAGLIRKINERADPNQLTPNVGACDMYHRKCIYHHSVGGPCKAESSPGKMARVFLARRNNQEKTIMAFNRGAITQATAAPPAEDANPGEGAVDTPAEETPAETTARRGRPRRAQAAGAAPSGDAVTVTFADGNTLELPANSPISTKLNAVHAAMFGE